MNKTYNFGSICRMKVLSRFLLIIDVCQAIPSSIRHVGAWPCFPPRGGLIARVTPRVDPGIGDRLQPTRAARLQANTNQQGLLTQG